MLIGYATGRQLAGEAGEAVARRARTPPGDTWIPGDCTNPGGVLGDAPADVVDALFLWP
jgi:hypothetical protein